MDSKPWYMSKTMWANIIALVVAVLGGFGIDIGLTPETQVSIVAGIMAVLNVVLRLTTKSGVTMKKAA